MTSTVETTTRPVVALTPGDPAGIGPEIVLKAVMDPRVRAACRPLAVADAPLMRWWAKRLGLPVAVRDVALPADAAFANGMVDVVQAGDFALDGFAPAAMRAENGRAILDWAGRAVELALAGEVAAIVAAPQTQKAIEIAGIPFDGYPGFIASRTGTPADDVFLMLANDQRRIVHVTLHVGLRRALELIDQPRVVRALTAADAALRNLGVARPRLAVSGVNPHAGEGGLFGREEIDIVAPAIAAAQAAGIDADGPFGADTMYLKDGYDGFVVMIHDQGHIPAKLTGFDRTAAFTIGTPVFFSSVAHGSAYDIAGRGVADPSALIATLLAMSRVRSGA
ncbi:MAG: PdxA family protein [Rhodospirillales bacterium]